jgi:hypothetical protein
MMRTLTNVSAEQAALQDQLGVKLFTPPPARFNPLTASDRELLVHGFPSRPDTRTQPEMAARWQEMMSRHRAGWPRPVTAHRRNKSVEPHPHPPLPGLRSGVGPLARTAGEGGTQPVGLGG